MSPMATDEPEGRYEDYRSIYTPGIGFDAPQPTIPCGSAILDPEHGVTEDTISPIFKPLTIRGVTFQNRIFLAPMCMYSCKDGKLSDFHVAHYGQYAIRGVPLITIEATAVVPQGLNTPQDNGLWSDEQIPYLKRVVDVVHSQSQKIGIQLQHAGRKSNVCPPWLGLKAVPDKFGGMMDKVQGPSPEPWNDNYCTPKEMTEADIWEVIEAFGAAAARAVKAGVDVVAVHGAHGYLIHSFASPASNYRTDQWGGSFENRIRFGVEVVRAIRRNIPASTLLFWKLSAVDWLPPGEGWELEDTVRYASILRDEGVDFLDVSSGGTDRNQKVQISPGYQVRFAEAVKKATPGLTVGAVGWIRDGKMVEDIIRSGKADAVSIAREFLRDPNFVHRVANEVGTRIAWIDQYHRAPLYGRNVESTTNISTDAKADEKVTLSDEKQRQNKTIVA